jgi:hypothetical protein
VLDCEEFAGAAKPGLNLVSDEQGAVLPAELLRAAQVAVVGQVDALALDRLDDEGGDRLAGQSLFERGEIVERNLDAVR